MSDFVIENGVLIKYTGKGGDVVIPEGVTEIGVGSFDSCTSIKYIVLNEKQFDSFTASGISAALIIRSKEGVSLFALVVCLLIGIA